MSEFFQVIDENTIRDPDGNQLKRHGNVLRLQLVSEPEPRTIGKISGHTLEIERNEEEHYYRLGQGWCFNWMLFLCADFFKFNAVHFISRFKNVNVYLGVGAMLADFQPMPQYKREGFEQQKCLPESFFGVKSEIPTGSPVGQSLNRFLDIILPLCWRGKWLSIAEMSASTRLEPSQIRWCLRQLKTGEEGGFIVRRRKRQPMYQGVTEIYIKRKPAQLRIPFEAPRQETPF